MSAAVFVKLFAIFVVVAIGWGVARSGRLGSGDAARVLSNAAYYIFVPALLYRTTARIDFEHLEARILVAFFVPTVALLVAVYAAGRRRRGTGTSAAEPSVRAMAASFGNTVQIGIPVAAALFGEAGLALHLTVVSLHSLVILTLTTTLVELDLARERRRNEGGSERLAGILATTVRQTLIHPVILPVLAGMATSLLGVPLPRPVDEILATLGQAVVPVCLILIGVSLAHYGVRGALGSALVVAALKLIVLPLAVLFVARFAFGLSGVPLAVVVMLAALPVGSNPLIFAQRYRALEGEVTTTVVVTTLAFVATAPLWLAVVGAVG